MFKFIVPAAMLVAGLASAVPASAAYVISGTRQNIGPGTAPGQGRCVPPYFSTSVFTPGNFVSGGMTNFGGFQLTASHCNLGPAPTSFVDGIGELLFENGDLLTGIYTGYQLATETPGIFIAASDWVITGGTGRFRDASGFMSHIGTLRVGMYQDVPSGFYDAEISGLLNLPAVPEPAAWAMMVAGFGLVGTVARRRRHNGPVLA